MRRVRGRLDDYLKRKLEVSVVMWLAKPGCLLGYPNLHDNLPKLFGGLLSFKEVFVLFCNIGGKSPTIQRNEIF